MERTVLIRGARQLLTLHGPTGPRRGDSMRHLGLIEDGALLITNGIITNVGPTRRIENLARARTAEEINATGRVVMPGFVDSHTHLIAAPPRVADMRHSGHLMESGRNLTQFSADHIRRTSAPSLEHHARKLLFGFMRHGSTTVEAKTGYGLDEAGEMKMLRVLSHLAESGLNLTPTFLAPHVPPPEFPGTVEQFLAWINAYLIPKVRTRNLAKFVDGVCDAGALTVEQAHGLLNAARRLGFATKLQTDLTARTGAVRMAVEMGGVSIAGLNHSDTSDATVLAQSRTVGVVMPGPVYQGYASRFAPARMLIDEGAAIALASGFHPPVSSTYNMMTVIAIACTHMGLSPEEAITAATINGAHALARSERAGSLEYGKEADLIMLGISDYREIPYQFGVNLVALTMQKGHVVYREGIVACGVES
ncbi:MAG TPA: amidohydrolase family protein [Bryobacteraceae bacterium]|nr:amidohydrolase family protein [Bryobacteraceae bacterium]